MSWADPRAKPNDHSITRSGNNTDEIRGVWRIEFRVGNAALKESGLRDPNRLLSELDSLLSLATETIRLVVPSETRTERSARPSRCPLDPRWTLLARVVFDRPQPPIARVRVKGGADMRNVSPALGLPISSTGFAPPRW